MRKLLKTEALLLYPAGFTLIPLHAYDAVRLSHGRTIKAGKSPLHAQWTTRAYSNKKTLEQAKARNLNVGVRLTAGQLVIDIDPRNGGDEGFKELCADIGLKALAFPNVITGSGGRHIYMAKPEDVRVLDTIEGYPGVEFKSKGRQVVAAGSIHPDTLKRYYWKENARPITAELPDAPKKLINLIRRPSRSAVTGGGQFDQEQIAYALEALDPEDFREHDKWLRLMMACHHASDGEARHEFVEWSVSDPAYSNRAEEIGRRWDSLHRNKADAVTYRTLNKYLNDAGAGDRAVSSAADDFANEPIDPDDGEEFDFDTPDTPAATRLSHVNQHSIDDSFALVNIGSKIRICYWGKSPLDRRVRVPEFWPEEEFHRALRNKFINVESKQQTEDGEAKTTTKRMPLSQWWLTQRDRYTYDGLIFDADAEEISESDEINLWRGFAVPETPGDWSRMRSHIRNVIASEDAESDAYILRWAAWVLQNPTRQAEVAVALISEGKGTGKGFFGRALCDLFGGHSLHIAKRNLLTGRFNAHFMQTAFLFCDEALWPGHPDDEGALKALITEPSLTIEPKGVNAFAMPNTLKVLMASNNKWVVPASGDDRRYAVFEVSDVHKQDKPYFAALAAELKNGGLGAMLHDLRTLDLEGWHPRNSIPQTTALAEQKARSLPPELKWLAWYLESGVLDCQHPAYPDRVEASNFFSLARRSNRGLDRWSDYEFARLLADWGVKRKRSNGSWWVFPPLNQMRRMWRERMPWSPPFSRDIRDWISDADQE